MTEDLQKKADEFLKKYRGQFVLPADTGELFLKCADTPLWIRKWFEEGQDIAPSSDVNPVSSTLSPQTSQSECGHHYTYKHDGICYQCKYRDDAVHKILRQFAADVEKIKPKLQGHMGEMAEELDEFDRKLEDLKKERGL